MVTMVLISSTAILVGIIGCLVIWGLDALRADEIDNPKPATSGARSLSAGSGDPRAIDVE